MNSKLLNLISTIAMLQSYSLLAETHRPGVIYGIDNRSDVFESSDSLMKELSHSTAAQIMNDNLEQKGNTFTIKAHTLAEEGICKSERFSSQLAAANCSGFLVGPDVLVTAGHCITSLSECQNHSWVFDYANTTEVKASFQFTKDQVFRCTKVIAREKNEKTKSDYAVVKLDRVVPNRTPLKFRKTGKPADDTVFTVLGHPTGLPLKITSDAVMRDNSNPYFFVANADTYGGNSGSAVVDSKSGLVEGILVRGDTDYEPSTTEDNCQISVIRPENGGRGEDSTRITNIKALRKL